MERLYNEKDGYTEEASKLDQEAIAALGPIVEKWAGLGYSLRDIQNILNTAVLDQVLNYILS